MLNGLLIFILGFGAFVFSGFLTWPIRKIAIRIGAMDAPNLERKTQSEPVPYLGGVSIALTISFLTYVAVLASDSNLSTFSLASFVLIPALFMGAMGLVDDLKGLPAVQRLVIQTLAGTVVAVVLVTTDTMGIAFANPLLNLAVSILWIVGICNSINFFDNVDGGAAGTVSIVTLGIAFIAFSQGQELVSALAVVTAGATLGFLMWNKPPARIYMGDAGALFLGVLVSVLTIRVNPGIVPNWKSLAIPPILLAVPILDTCIAVLSRIKRGVSPFHGGRDHLSHRLIRRGLNRRIAVLSLWGLSGFFGLFAVSVYTWPEKHGTGIICGAVLFWAILFIWFWRIPASD